MRRASATQLAVFTLSTSIAAAAPAAANHVHTYFDVYHGLGDGGDANGHIHPFTDYYTSNYMEADVEQYGVWVDQQGTATHIHQDKNNVNECTYNYWGAAEGTYPYYVSYHAHNHHLYCA